MTIQYHHNQNAHSMEGARAALISLFPERAPASLLDVGCGQGTWLAAALALGVNDILGVDGIAIPPEELRIPGANFRQSDLRLPLQLDRRFDVALCLEVAEHLEPPYANVLVTSLAAHTDTIYFSAGVPGQPGEHHVNCQWPAYWQELFNKHGFECTDAPRWQIWHDNRIEPWYRQNLFLAHRAPARAGTEPRLAPVVHPDFLDSFSSHSAGAILAARSAFQFQIEHGAMPLRWYGATLLKAVSAKIRRRAARAANR